MYNKVDSLSGSVGVGLLVYLTLQQKDKGATVEQPADGTVFISHADGEQDAREVAERLQARYGVKVKLLTQIGPVIGSHAGQGTIALCGKMQITESCQAPRDFRAALFFYSFCFCPCIR